jgi:S-adenosylmethionine hydrolase
VNFITLTTDFGTRDWFVGTLKGVLLRLQPRAVIVDLTHEIAGGDIRAGAFALMAGHAFFPKGTVHVAVVDPGVGGPRRAIAVQTADYFFIGPDNGVLSFALRREKIKSIHALENEKYFLKPVSRTFHGRDVFAPVAAHLSRGVAVQKFGPRVKDFVRLDWPGPRFRDGSVGGEIVHVDRFGNLITNIDAESLRVFGDQPCDVLAKRKRLCSVAAFYGAVPVGRPLAVLGSTGFLEIAIYGGAASERLALRPGDPVSVRPGVKSR